MHALLIATPEADPLRHVASMSLARRNHLTLTHAGAEAIVLLCPDAELASRLREHLADTPTQVVERAQEAAALLTDETLVASASRVHDKGLGSLMETREDASRPFAATDAPGAPILLPAAPDADQLEALLRGGLPALRERLEGVAVADAPEPFIDIEVDSDAADAEATEALWQSCRKPIDGWVSRHLNRYISLAISRRIVDTPIAPNHISIFCIALGLLSLVLVLQGTYWSILAGAIALKANSIIDGVDGELARVRWQFSPIGETLDSLGDNVSNFSFFGALVYVLYERGDDLFATLGLAGLLMWSVHLVWIYVQLARKRRGNVFVVQSNTVKAARGLLARVFDVLSKKILRRDGFVMLALIFTAFAWYEGVMIMVLIGGAAVFFNVIGHYALALKARVGRAAEA